MKADFETVALFMGFIANSAGLAALAKTFDRTELKDLKSDLSSLIRQQNSDPVYVRKRFIALRREVLSPFVLLLHAENLLIYGLLMLILILGPDRIFGSEAPGALAEPLTTWEKRIYWTWFAINLLGYLATCVYPTYQLMKVYAKTKEWLRTHAPRQRK